jgi:BirA family transcriptional regulator, biotin operon repressor / biotin---[acetyl-CoA-carboxylase] ligase
MFIGQQIVRLEEVDSTNSFGLRMLRESSTIEGTVVIAKNQTQGRGQRGNYWASESGKNLTCSILLRPSFLDAGLQFDLTRVVALGITDVLMSILPAQPIHIKWPNDIMVGKKKICGVLIENTLSGNQVSASVVGIGFNLNQSAFGEEAPRAISLAQILGHETELMLLLHDLCAAIEVRYLQLRAGKTESLRTDYLNRLFRIGIPMRFTDFKSVFEATIKNVTESGLLVVEDEDGVERKFAMKEIGMV